MEDLFCYIDNEIKKIDDFSFHDSYFNFLKDFFTEYKLVNFETMMNADRARLITAFIISYFVIDVDLVYDFVSSNKEGFLNMSKMHFDLINTCISDDIDLNYAKQLFSFLSCKDRELYYNIFEFFKENDIHIFILTINYCLNVAIERYKMAYKFMDNINADNSTKYEKKVANAIYKNYKKNDRLLESFSEIRANYEKDAKERKGIYSERNRLKRSYEDLLSYLKKAVSKGAVVEYNDSMFGKIKDDDFKKIVLKYIYIYNKEIYDNVNSRYLRLVNNSLLSYSTLLDSYGINISQEALVNLCERNSVDDLDIMVKTLKLKGFDISTISMIIQVSSLSTIKYLVSLIEKGIINKDLLLSDLNLFNKDSSVYKNFVSILNMFEDKKINPNFFQGSQHIYLIDKNIIEENINILIEYKLFNFLKCGGYYSLFNSLNLRDSINILRSLKLDSYLVNDLTILNYSSRFNRLEVLNVLNVSISSYDELLSYLTDDNFFIPDSMIPSYLSDTSFSKSL